MTVKEYAIAGGAGIVLFAAGGVVGRYSLPAKTVETVKTVETKVVDQDAIAKAVAFAQSEWKRDVKTTTRVIYRDGKPVERIVYRDASSAGSSSSGASSSSEVATHVEETKQTETKKVTESRASWAIEAHGAWGSASPYPDQYGGQVQFRLLGPVWIGVGAEKTDKVRPSASVRMEF